MLKLVPEYTTAFDTLFSCVETVLEFHNMRRDLAGNVTSFPMSGPVMRMADLPAFAEHIGMNLRIIRSDVEHISNTLMPIILPLIDDQFAVVMPAEDGGMEFLVPGQTSIPLEAEYFESWVSGRVIELKPK